MTYRERRMAKAERLREWAGKRQSDATAVFERDRRFTEDHAFNTQPGHIPERARLIKRQDRAIESLNKAESMANRADGIERAAEHAIYSDDEDAVARLRERIETLEGERARIKAYNASCRKGQRDVNLLDAKQQADLVQTAKTASYMIGKKGEMPAYHLTNLSGNINRQKKRLEALSRASA